MGAAYFYHLTQQPLEAALPRLLEASLKRGWRVAVRGRNPRYLDWLDQKLWLEPEDGFLPHGQAGGPHDALQPVLLTERGDLPNDPACLMAVDGAAVSAEEAGRMERTCILFDGNDTQALQAARGLCRSLTAAGCAAQYWSEESGSWKKKAES